MSDRHPPVIDERTYQRRRLGVLAGLLAFVLAVTSFAGGAGGEGPRTVDVAAGDQVVRAASVRAPTAVRQLLSETTTTLVEATGATTTTVAPTTVPPSTTTPTAAADPEPAPAASDAVTEAEEPEPEPAAETSTEATAAPETTTTRAPAPTTSAPPTTRAPAPTTTTTAPPAPQRSGDGYAYDDPRSTQVWYDLAQCESGGNWSIDTGNGYYGGLQFSLGTWGSVGGTGYPHEHPAATQIDMGRRLQARQGWGAWPHCSEELGLR